MESTGFLVGYKDVSGKWNFSYPTKLMSREDAQKILEARKIEYPASANDYAVFEITMQEVA